MFETWYKMTALIQSGLDITPIITHHFRYKEIIEGHRADEVRPIGQDRARLGSVDSRAAHESSAPRLDAEESRRLMAELWAELDQLYGNQVPTGPDLARDGSTRAPHSSSRASIEKRSAALRFGRSLSAIAEVKRMYVRPRPGGAGVARAMMHELEQLARAAGFTEIWLETGLRQPGAIRLYESLGYTRIAAFGDYKDDPMSVCYGKWLTQRPRADRGMKRAASEGRLPLHACPAAARSHAAAMLVMLPRLQQCEARLRIAPAENLDRLVTNAPAIHVARGSPCRGRSCSARQAPSRNHPPCRSVRWRERETSCRPASATNRPPRCRCAVAAACERV